MPVVWITGGARRIGKGLALRFAERGYDVAFTYNTSGSLAEDVRSRIEAAGRRCAIARCDVRDTPMLAATMEHFVAEVGLADVVVSNAGIFPPPAFVSATSLEDLRYVLDVNTFPL